MNQFYSSDNAANGLYTAVCTVFKNMDSRKTKSLLISILIYLTVRNGTLRFLLPVSVLL